MKPINDRVVVKPAPAEEKTTGGIIIPDTAKEKPQKGEVVAVGPGKEDIKMTVKNLFLLLLKKKNWRRSCVRGFRAILRKALFSVII